jgi:RNA polymerase sigma-70 factor (ECF subfamily)
MSATTMDRRAMWADLVREHQAGVWRYLRYLGAEAHEADDLTQETFLAVMRSGFEYRSPLEAAQYLRRAARNQLLIRRRRESREPTVGDLEAAEAVWAEAAGDDGLNDYLLALEDCLQRAVDARWREAIVLRYRDGASRDQIGERLDIATEGVKSLLRRARAALRDCVERKMRT